MRKASTRIKTEPLDDALQVLSKEDSKVTAVTPGDDDCTLVSSPSLNEPKSENKLKESYDKIVEVICPEVHPATERDEVVL